MIHPLAGMALVLGALGCLMLGLRGLRGRVHAELLRKAVHIGMGLLTLSFPFLFRDVWPVATLALTAVGLLLALRSSAFLKQRLGGVVDGVARESFGEVYFPVAVACLFAFAGKDPVLYSIPILLLALADAVAALIGVRYGASRYTTDEGAKSWEGSVMFFLVAFLSVHVPLLLFSPETGRAECLLIGLIMGLLVMLLEAIAWQGLDNLFIPLGGYMLLRALLRADLVTLSVGLTVALGLVIYSLLWTRRTTLTQSAALGAAFIGFVACMVGGWRWLIPPLTLFSTYAVLFPRTNTDGVERTHHIYDVFRATAVGMGWLFLCESWGQPGLLLPYTVSFAAQLAIIGVVRRELRLRDPACLAPLAGVVGVSGVVMLGPYALLEWWQPTLSHGALLPALLVTPLGVLVGVAGERVGSAGTEMRPHRRWWLRQVGVAAGSALMLIFVSK